VLECEKNISVKREKNAHGMSKSVAPDCHSFLGVVHPFGGPCDTMQAYLATVQIRAHTCGT